jgi:hypothetical protein
MIDDPYLVWSHEHRGWWRPRCIGYTPRVSEAGRYTRDGALTICANAIPDTAQRIGALPEIPVRLADLMAMQARFDRDRVAALPEPWR